jgi:magnesium transporter
MDENWIDLNSPTKEEVDSLILRGDLDPIIAKDLLTPTPTQHVQSGDKVIYAVLHLPTFKHNHTVGDTQEIDFVISENSIITARYDSIEALHYFAKKVEVNEILNKTKKSNLFFGIMNEIYKSISDELSCIEDWIEEIEKNIFEGKEKLMVSEISNAGRNLLNFKKIIEAHGNVLEMLKTTGSEKFGEDFGSNIRTLENEWRRVMRTINNQLDLVIEFRETNNSILSTKQNEIMKQLTVIGSVILPLTIVVQLFSMSFQTFPLSNHPYAFWIVIGIMAVIMFIMLTFAKIKKWM